MGIGFMVLIPFLFWLFIVMLIIAVSKSGAKSRRPGRARAPQRMATSRKPAQNGRVSSVRPKMQEGLFDMSLGKDSTSKKKMSLGSFRNTGFDKYETKGRRKDLVTGYDRTVNVKRAANMQFSHTYDGHEPWDKCLPKEKDPWDKDFYA